MKSVVFNLSAAGFPDRMSARKNSSSRSGSWIKVVSDFLNGIAIVELLKLPALAKSRTYHHLRSLSVNKLYRK